MRISIVTLICITCLNANATNHELEVVDNLIKVGVLAKRASNLYFSESDDELRNSIDSTYTQKISDLYANAVRIFRENNVKPKTLTIKNLRDATYNFLHKNGLDDIYAKLAIDEIEVPSISQALPVPLVTCHEYLENYNDLPIKCIVESDGRYIIKPHRHEDKLDLFHNEKYNDIQIGGRLTDYNMPVTTCFHDSSEELSSIKMGNAIEGYISSFISVSGTFFQTLTYDVTDLEYKYSYYAGLKSYALSHAMRIIDWIFEFRYFMETTSKDNIFTFAINIPFLFDEQNEKIPYYFSNLALSLANQSEKKLVDIADQAIDAIKTGVVINNGEDIRTEFTCDSNAYPDEYGIDSNGVVRFNAEKNKASIRDLLTRMGYDADAVLERVYALTK